MPLTLEQAVTDVKSVRQKIFPWPLMHHRELFVVDFATESQSESSGSKQILQLQHARRLEDRQVNYKQLIDIPRRGLSGTFFCNFLLFALMVEEVVVLVQAAEGGPATSKQLLLLYTW